MRIWYVIWLLWMIGGCTSAPITQPTPTRMIPTPTQMPTSTPVIDTPEGRGEALFTRFEKGTGFACATCHYSDRQDRLIGPGMKGLLERFLSYGLDGTVEDYVRVAILDPASFHAEASPPYPLNAMPTTYADIYSEQEVEDLVTYILSR